MLNSNLVDIITSAALQSISDLEDVNNSNTQQAVQDVLNLLDEMVEMEPDDELQEALDNIQMALFPFLEEILEGDIYDFVAGAEIALFTLREIFNLPIN